MKLTTLKVSVPVLMMMMFQSGYGVSDWFASACKSAIIDNNSVAAVETMMEHNPESVQMTDEAQNLFLEKWRLDIAKAVQQFIPRGLKDDEDFKGDVLTNLYELTEINSEKVQNYLKAMISLNFFVDVDFLGHDKGVADEVSRVLGDITAEGSVWRTSDVPATTTNEDGKKVILPDLLGDGQEEEGTIRAFIKVYKDTDDEGTRKEALSRLLEIQQFDALGGEKLNDTYNTIDGKISTQGGDDGDQDYAETTKNESAVYEGLVDRANEVRGEYIPGIQESLVPWGPEDAVHDDVWKSTAADWIGDFWTKDKTADQLKRDIYNDTARTLAVGQNPPEGGPGYGDSDTLTYYLDLFGNRNINGNEDPDNPDEKEVFLQSVLAKIETDILAKGAEGTAPGTEDRFNWVDHNQGTAREVVEQAVYSIFGDKYAELLHHSDEPIDSPKGLFDAITVGGESERKAVAEEVETFDKDTAEQVAQRLVFIKDVVPTE